MKQAVSIIALLCVILAGTSNQAAMAQTTAAVTTATFAAKSNQLDSLIGAGAMTDAQTVFMQINDMMKSVLAVTKTSIFSATSTAQHDSYYNLLTSQQIPLYQVIFRMKSDLAGNRSVLHTKLTEFGATIY
jgi:hypothetical protein